MVNLLSNLAQLLTSKKSYIWCGCIRSQQFYQNQLAVVIGPRCLGLFYDFSRKPHLIATNRIQYDPFDETSRETRSIKQTDF